MLRTDGHVGHMEEIQEKYMAYHSTEYGQYNKVRRRHTHFYQKRKNTEAHQWSPRKKWRYTQG